MKKVIAFMLAAFMVLGMMSCADPNTDNETDSLKDSETQTETEADTEEAVIEYPFDPSEAFDFILEKERGEDFVILTISDPQMLEGWWMNEESVEGNSLRYTMEELIENTDPDLILCTGDFTADGREEIFRELGKYVDSFGIPWATVWGNHDHTYKQLSFYAMPLDQMEALYTTGFENCLFKAGASEMGSGNYTIGICENGKFVEAIFMMDTHQTQKYHDDAGNAFEAEASLNDAQKQWYRDKVNLMKQLGCNESILVTHQPLTGHNTAMKAAVEDLNAYNSLLTPDSALKGVGWKEEYKDTSFGVLVTTCAGEVSGHIHPEDGMHALFKELDHTKNAIC